MIYPFDAAYAQEVLRKNYEYAAMLSTTRERLAAKAQGLVSHDRLLANWDSETEKAHIRSIALDRYGCLTKNPS
ncbi:hypothetical protein DOX48_08255 [Cronobacter malonaticus]|nr:hypothetical protein AFK66_022100 [Cronobacter malonaticus LMG 23826]EGT4313458.1 hypothetical protein [Cronobacter malonaticus]PUY89842.1 hypothetical protein B8W56_07810 [Cronobacter sakazakii]PUZ08179.1 hypothetical protein B8W52_05820 [Cronobacter sakazakii]